MTPSLITPRRLFSVVFAVLLIGLFAESKATAAAAQKLTFSGDWNNRKYNTKGPLVAELTVGKGTSWSGRFTGKGLGKPFAYTTALRATQGKGGTINLTGTSNVDGDSYTWRAVIRGTQLIGAYQSKSGNNGRFTGRRQQR